MKTCGNGGWNECDKRVLEVGEDQGRSQVHVSELVESDWGKSGSVNNSPISTKSSGGGAGAVDDKMLIDIKKI
jgi:hypothetical protein